MIRTQLLVVALILITASPAAAGEREVALTFDDLPAVGGGDPSYVLPRIIATLTREKAPAIGFVNGAKMEAGDRAARLRVLRQWVNAGFELGNHTYSHVAIDRVPFERYRDDLIRGESAMYEVTKPQRLYFRHPQLRTGPTAEYKRALDRLLKERGYTVAPVTVDNNDYIFDLLYLDAKRRGDANAKRRVAAEYVAYMERIFEHFEALSHDFLGREVRQTLLLHANELNADLLPDLLQMLRRRGYRFISLGEALRDPAYALPDAQAKKGLSWLHRWMLAKKLETKPEPLQAEWVDREFERLRTGR